MDEFTKTFIGIYKQAYEKTLTQLEAMEKINSMLINELYEYRRAYKDLLEMYEQLQQNS